MDPEEEYEKKRKTSTQKAKEAKEEIDITIEVVDGGTKFSPDKKATDILQELLDSDKMPLPFLIISLKKETIGKLVNEAFSDSTDKFVSAHIVFNRERRNDSKLFLAEFRID